jgi:hypothetical protein
MRYFLDAKVNGSCGPLISVALVPEDVNFAPFYEAIDCADPTDWVRENVPASASGRTATRDRVADVFADYFLDDPDPLLVADWPAWPPSRSAASPKL